MNRRRLWQITGALGIASVSLGVAIYVAFLDLDTKKLFDDDEENEPQDHLQCDLPVASGALNAATLRPLPSLQGLPEISGLAFWPELSSPERKVFVAVDDKQGEAVFRVILTEGPEGPRVEVVKDTLDKKLHNAEGITYLGDNRFAVVEEQRQRAIVVLLDPAAPGQGKVRCLTEPLDGGRFRELCKKNQRRGDPLHLICNSGLEGIAFDRTTGRLYFVQEKLPKRLFHVDASPLLSCGMEGPKREKKITFPEIIEPTWVSGSDQVSDLSDLLALPGGRVLLLSQECAALAEFDIEGNALSALELTPPELSEVEGVAWDGADRLYLVGESLDETGMAGSPFYELILPPGMTLGGKERAENSTP